MNSLKDFKRSARRLTRSIFKRQAMAICYRESAGVIELLLVSKKSSRSLMTFPKGTVEPGETAWHAASREAYEEAGVSGEVDPGRIGTFYYRKRNRLPLIRVDVFPMRVEDMSDSFPEARIRERQWLATAEAKRIVPSNLWSMIEAAFGAASAE